ncbi:MAG: DUF4197 domain-containing protein [Novosphingobium sp.]|jgi:hypothetical protein|nr:DUF4197 domain-containing protein [Novosphingobium sp.]
MAQVSSLTPSRRAFLAGTSAAALLALPACSSMGGISFTEAIRRLLVLSSERAFARLTAPDGYWDNAVERIGLDRFLGARGDLLGRILTSQLFKDRLEDVIADVAVRGSYRLAPIVSDTVRIIGIQNAVDLARGGPTAATDFLRRSMADGLIETLVPEIGSALRVARDPLMGQLLAALTGVDIDRMARGFSNEVENAIWYEIGAEEAAIRANPEDTRDPVLIAALRAL